MLVSITRTTLHILNCHKLSISEFPHYFVKSHYAFAHYFLRDVSYTQSNTGSSVCASVLAPRASPTPTSSLAPSWTSIDRLAMPFPLPWLGPSAWRLGRLLSKTRSLLNSKEVINKLSPPSTLLSCVKGTEFIIILKLQHRSLLLQYYCSAHCL